VVATTVADVTEFIVASMLVVEAQPTKSGRRPPA
jgi:hypothetical protein